MSDAMLARIRVADVGRLGAFRATDLRVKIEENVWWAFSEVPTEALTLTLRAFADGPLFTRDRDAWVREGEHLPAFDVPDLTDAQPLASLLHPSTLPEADEVPRDLAVGRLSIQRSNRRQDATAVMGYAEALADWVALQPAKILDRFTCTRRGKVVVVRGANPPMLWDGRRLWGAGVLLPLGFELTHGLTDRQVRDVTWARADDVLVWLREGFERIPASAFGPLTRAGARINAQ